MGRRSLRLTFWKAIVGLDNLVEIAESMSLRRKLCAGSVVAIVLDVPSITYISETRFLGPARQSAG